MNWEPTTQKICSILTPGRKTLTMKLSVSLFILRLLVLCEFISALIIAFNPPAKAQKVEMDKLEKAKKERTKVSLTTKKSGLLCQSASGASLHQLYFISTLPPSDTQKSMLPSWALVTAARAQPRADVLVGFTHSGLLHKNQLLPPPPSMSFFAMDSFDFMLGIISDS